MLKYCTGVNFRIIVPTVDTLCPLSRITTAYLVTPDQQVACVAYDFSTGVTAIGPKFSTKSLSADELRALAVPFLKDQMGDDYAAEPGDPDKDVTSLIQMPKALFFLRE